MEKPIEQYEWKNVKAIDIGYWAARREGWELLQVIHFIGDDIAVMYREKQDKDNGK